MAVLAQISKISLYRELSQMGLQQKVSWHHLIWKLEPEGCRAIYFCVQAKKYPNVLKSRGRKCALYGNVSQISEAVNGFLGRSLFIIKKLVGVFCSSLCDFEAFLYYFLIWLAVLFKIEIRHSMGKAESRLIKISLNLSSIFGYIKSSTKLYAYCFGKSSFAFSYLKKVQ